MPLYEALAADVALTGGTKKWVEVSVPPTARLHRVAIVSSGPTFSASVYSVKPDVDGGSTVTIDEVAYPLALFEILPAANSTGNTLYRRCTLEYGAPVPIVGWPKDTAGRYPGLLYVAILAAADCTVSLAAGMEEEA